MGCRQGTIVAKVEAAVRGEGVDAQSRYAHQSVLIYRQLANSLFV